MFDILGETFIFSYSFYRNIGSRFNKLILNDVRYKILYTESVYNVNPILPKNLSHVLDFYEHVSFKMLVFVVFVKNHEYEYGYVKDIYQQSS